MQEPSRRLRELRGIDQETERGNSAAAATATTTTAAAEHSARCRVSSAGRRRYLSDMPQDQVR